MEGEESKEVLVEEREEDMVGVTEQRNPVRRMGWFINPSGGSGRAPFVPSRHKAASFAAPEAPEILFKGWRSHLRKWEEWVHKLEPIYGDSWKKAGISEAIKASVYKIRRDAALVLGIAAYWCEETSSFLFPWGEATITLEDVMVLGGFPVVGEPVRGSLDGELAEMELRLAVEHKKFYKYSCKKPEQSAWMRHFVEGEGDEFEHVAFLSLWLSRFVFPAHPEKTVSLQMIPIAVRLARGARIALAPALLASLYRDLQAVKNCLISKCREEVPSLFVWAPFDLLQMWVWERFVALRPEMKNSVDYGEPRTKRWHDISKKMEFSFIRWVFESPSEFQWRPYVSNLDNWRKPSFYRENGEWIHGCADKDEDLRSFAQCLRASALVGVDCVKQYLPHRVAMQFGLDQDLPAYVPRSYSTWEAAWKTYEIDADNVVFYVPPQLFESDVTLQYSVWWKKYMLSCCIDVVKSVVGPHISLVIGEKAPRNAAAVKKNKKEKKDVSLTIHKKRKLQDFYDTPLSDWPDFENRRCDGEEKHVKSDKTSSAANKIQNQKLSGEGKEENKENLEALGHNEEQRAQTEEDLASEPLDKEGEATVDKTAVGDVERTEISMKLSKEHAEQSNQIAAETRENKIENKTELGEACPPDPLEMMYRELLEDVQIKEPEASVPFLLQARFKLEQERKAKELEEEMKIKKLKEEIATMQAKLMDLESQSESSGSHGGRS
ncbi:uncharacterized protein LOC103717142 [Phoenix dactylifera]|uniref:Uncharacterized protein LOC103717142 n=1 Tax=Phoenix dactylifera TaxID=42345 RepID=A0A8B7CPJ5_PHODC|nr:uncharacterized protein LOC103717142 [Phoenix dactylifera]